MCACAECANAQHARGASLLIMCGRSLGSQARVEPVHYLQGEAGREAGAAERVRDLTSAAACHRPPISTNCSKFR